MNKTRDIAPGVDKYALIPFDDYRRLIARSTNTGFVTAQTMLHSNELGLVKEPDAMSVEEVIKEVEPVKRRRKIKSGSRSRSRPVSPPAIDRENGSPPGGVIKQPAGGLTGGAGSIESDSSNEGAWESLYFEK